jgi:transposase
MNFLTGQDREQLKAQHKRERDGRVRDRIKAVLLTDEGWTPQQIAKVLLISDQAVRDHVHEYQASHKLNPESGGSEEKLSEEQSKRLIAHLEAHTYLYVKVRHEVAQILVVAKQQLQILLCNSTRMCV